MFLESLTIQNFRKFGSEKNTIFFVGLKEIKDDHSSDNSLVAPSSTLIIGKNNTGKTTVVRALNLIIEKRKPSAHDFNIEYLRNIIKSFEDIHNKSNRVEGREDLELPFIEFILKININIEDGQNNKDASEQNDDILNNIYQFVPLSFKKNDSVEIKIRYEIKERELFNNDVISIVKSVSSEGKSEKLVILEKIEMLCDLLNNENIYKLTYFNSSGTEVSNLNLKDLIQVKEIKANRHLKDGVLSEVYQKIIANSFNNDQGKADLESNINSINTKIKNSIGDQSEKITTVLNEIENSNHVGVELSGNVTHDSILKNLIKYSFSENDDFIPEDQFGLGYINLLNIIGEIIHYVESYEDKSHQNRVNLLFIEEPEAFMHPQMQEFFITRIDNAVKKVLNLTNTSNEENQKVLHCQIAITTHSSNIVNSKIHSCNSFDNINYLTTDKKTAVSVKLNDEVIRGEKGYMDNEGLKFIKKHIKYKVSELFFADAVIFVEGVTEETLLHYYLDQDENLKNYYISIFNINGAHGKLYYPLIKALSIPCLIITDIDIKREPCEKGEKNKNHTDDGICNHCNKKPDDEKKHKIYKQITSLNNRTTTNDTIKDFYIKEKDSDTKNPNKVNLINVNYFEEGNLYVIFQKDSIENQYSTSFEEALILTNYKNVILNIVLEECKPQIYKNIIKTEGKPNDLSKLIPKSFELQKKLSDSKSDFANGLLYKIITEDGDIPKLPNYICDGFEWLSSQLDSSLNGIKI